MNARMSKLLFPALLAATIPAAAAFAQGQPQSQPEPKQNRERAERPRLSPDARKRLQEGRQEGRKARFILSRRRCHYVSRERDLAITVRSRLPEIP